MNSRQHVIGGQAVGIANLDLSPGQVEQWVNVTLPETLKLAGLTVEQLKAILKDLFKASVSVPISDQISTSLGIGQGQLTSVNIGLSAEWTIQAQRATEKDDAKPRSLRLGLDLVFDKDPPGTSEAEECIKGWTAFISPTNPDAPPLPPIVLQRSPVLGKFEKIAISVAGRVLSNVVSSVLRQQVAGIAPLGRRVYTGFESTGPYKLRDVRVSWNKGLEARVAIIDLAHDMRIGDVVLRADLGFRCRTLREDRFPRSSLGPQRPIPTEAACGPVWDKIPPTNQFSLMDITDTPALCGCAEDWSSVEFTEAQLQAYPKLRELFAQCTRLVHHLSAKVCTSFELSSEFGTLLVLLGLAAPPLVDGVSGGLLSGLLGPLVGVLSSALAPVLLLVANVVLPPQLGQRLPKAVCLETADDNCWQCLLPIDFEIEAIGQLRLGRVEPREDSFVASLVVFPERKLLKPGTSEYVPLPPAQLVIAKDEIGPWSYPSGRCELPAREDPVKILRIVNRGGLPLQVCEIAQRLLPGADLVDLEILEPAPGTAFPIRLQPGQSREITVRARLLGNTAYNPDAPAPILLRVLSTAGSEIIDLNKDDPARLLSDRERLPHVLSEILCGIVLRPSPLWNRIPFTDPLPFRPGIRVLERIDVQLPAAPGATLQIEGRAGPLGTALSQDGLLRLSAMEALGPGARSDRLGLRVARSGPAAPRLARGDAPALRRFVYRQSAQLRLGVPIVDVQRSGEELLVLTAEELLTGRPAAGQLCLSARRAVSAGTRLLRLGGQPALLGPRGHLLFPGGGEARLAPRGEISGAAALGAHLFVAGSEGLARLSDRGATPLCGGASVRDLCAAEGSVFGLIEGRLFDLGGAAPRDLGRRSAALRSIGGQLALCSDEGVVIVDRQGRERARYPGVPPWADLVHFPGLAVEVRAEEGLLMLHEWQETWFDSRHLSLGLPGLLEDHAAAPPLLVTPLPRTTQRGVRSTAVCGPH